MGNALAEWHRENERKRAETREMISACFREAVRLMGEAETRRCWLEVAKRKGGKPKGTTNKERDEQILSHYDCWIRRHPDTKRRAIKFVADYLTHKHPGKYGPNANAIVAQLRRLLARRGKACLSGGNVLAEMAQIGKFPLGMLPYIMNK